MKKFLGILVACSLAMGSTAFAAENKIAVTVEGINVAFTDATPFADSNSRTLSPLRTIADAMGAEVVWEEATKTATFTKLTSVAITPVEEEKETVEAEKLTEATKVDETDKTEATKTDEAKTDDTKADETKTDDTKADETKTDEAKTDDTKADETDDTEAAKTDEAKIDDTKADETDDTEAAKTDDAKTDKTDDTKVDETKPATIQPRIEISFTVDSKTAKTKIVANDGKVTEGTVTMDTAAINKDGRIYAPVRYLAEAFGYKVDWNAETSTVAIATEVMPLTPVVEPSEEKSDSKTETPEDKEETTVPTTPEKTTSGKKPVKG